MEGAHLTPSPAAKVVTVRRPMKKKQKITISVFVSCSLCVLLLYFSFKGVNGSQILQSLTTVHPGYLLAAQVVLVISVLLRAYVYHRLFAPYAAVNIWLIFQCLVIGNMCNAILPMKAGDLAKVYLLGEKAKVSKTYTLSAMIIERLFDILMLTALLLAVLLIFNPGRAYGIAALMLGATAMVFLALLVTIYRYGDKILVKIGGIRFLSKLAGFLSRKIDMMKLCFKNMCTPVDIATITGIFIAIWGLYGFMGYLAGKSIGLELSARFILFMIVTVNVASTVVSTPGALGVYQCACIMVFMKFSLSRESALTFSVISGIMPTVVYVLLGWLFLVLMHSKLSQIIESDPTDEDSSQLTSPAV